MAAITTIPPINDPVSNLRPLDSFGGSFAVDFVVGFGVVGFVLASVVTLGDTLELLLVGATLVVDVDKLVLLITTIVVVLGLPVPSLGVDVSVLFVWEVAINKLEYCVHMNS